MKNPIILLLSCLLHHANRVSRDPRFYAIKAILLSRFGQPVGLDLQRIEGKVCYTCNGSGYTHYFADEEKDYCADCFASGYYKRPFWSLLVRVKFGGFTFHTPIKKVFNEKEAAKLSVLASNSIQGYIEHAASINGPLCLSILFLLFDLSYWWKLNVTRRIARFFYRLKYHPSNDTVHLLLFRKKHTVKKWLSGLGDFSKTNHHHVPEATNYDSSDFSELPF
jgi:hypothetical protein